MTRSPLTPQGPNWEGQTAVVIASGPSLTREQVDCVRAAGVKTIVVNGAWKAHPEADVMFALDFLFWKVNINAVRQGFKGELWSTDNASRERFGVKRWVGSYAPGLGKGIVHTSGNSGCGAINLAVCFGARRVLLLGFDMKEGPNGEKHWHKDHPAPLVQKQTFGDWVHKTKKLAEDAAARGVEVVNCSPGSAVPYFRRSTIEEELK